MIDLDPPAEPNRRAEDSARPAGDSATGADVIDLDRQRASTRTRRRRRPYRALVLVLLLAVVSLGGSDGLPVEPLDLLTEVPAARQATFLIAGEAVYVAGGGPRGHLVEAYPLHGGPVIWSVPVDLSAGDARLAMVADVLLVSVAQAGATGTHVVALDAATGAVRWTSHDQWSGPTPDADWVLLWHGQLVVDDGTPPPVDWSVVDARSGRVRSTFQVAAGCRSPLPNQVAASAVLVAACPHGHDLDLRSIDLSTGRVQARTTLPGRGRILPDLNLLAGRLLLTRPGDLGGQIVLAGYDPRTLRPAWTWRATTAGTDILDCGTVLCVGTDEEIDGLEPDTGAVRWRRPGHDMLAMSGGGNLITLTRPDKTTIVLDAATGTSLLAVPASWSIVRSGPQPPWFARWDANAALAVFAVASAGPPAGLTLVGRAGDLDPASCRTDSRYLICHAVRRTGPETLLIWRYRPVGSSV